MVVGALATQAAPVRVRSESDDRQPEEKTSREPMQRLLFAARSQSKVIPFESFGVSRAESRPAAKQPSARAQTRRQGARNSDAQGALDFLPPAQQTARKLKTTVEAVIYCDAPVAAKMHRGVAAALDLSMILIAFGLFLLTFHLGGGEVTLTQPCMAPLGAAFAFIALFYGLVWVVVNTESPGKRWTNLRLTNFDGFPPDNNQRLLRFAGACLSFAAGGLGLLWAVADEESLTWQDHISKTFLTLEESPTNFVRQR